MKGIKIMQAHHYKMGDVIDTTNIKYGNRIRSMQEHGATRRLINAVISCSSTLGHNFEELLLMCLASQQDKPRMAVPGLPDLKEKELLKIARTAAPITDTNFSPAFWEALYEQVRKAERPESPSRLNSYFIFKDAETARWYIREHWRISAESKVVCEVDYANCRSFEADLRILDQIEPDHTFAAARPQILRYFDGAKTPNPKIEILAKGKVVLGEVVNNGVRFMQGA